MSEQRCRTCDGCRRDLPKDHLRIGAKETGDKVITRLEFCNWRCLTGYARGKNNITADELIARFREIGPSRGDYPSVAEVAYESALRQRPKCRHEPDNWRTIGTTHGVCGCGERIRIAPDPVFAMPVPQPFVTGKRRWWRR